MATIDSVAGRGAERYLPPAKYAGGHNLARPDSGGPAVAPQDVVQVSDSARALASGKAVELQLSPEMLRKLMAAPEQPAGQVAAPNRVES